jgi:hypothetical protein
VAVPVAPLPPAPLKVRLCVPVVQPALPLLTGAGMPPVAGDTVSSVVFVERATTPLVAFVRLTTAPLYVAVTLALALEILPL